MDEQEWGASDDPQAMLEWLTAGKTTEYMRRHAVASPRCLRLFACACCRQVWHLMTDPRSRNVVEVAERYADGLAAESDLLRAKTIALAACHSPSHWAAHAAAWTVADVKEHSRWLTTLLENVAHAEGRSASMGQAPHLAALLRCIVGNPWRPVSLPITPVVVCSCPTYGPDGWVIPSEKRKCSKCGGKGYTGGECHWLTPAVVSLASAAYDLRQPAGTLDPERLAILADCLLDAGCQEEAVLAHLRSAGPHVRGCWSLDCVLGLMPDKS